MRAHLKTTLIFFYILSLVFLPMLEIEMSQGCFFFQGETNFVVTFWKPESFICHFPHLCALVRNSRYTTFTNCNGLVLLQQPVKGFAKTATCNTSASRQKWEFPKINNLSQSFMETGQKEMPSMFFPYLPFPDPPPIPSTMNKPIFCICPAFFTKDLRRVFLLKDPLHWENLNWVLSDWIQKSVQIQGLLQIWSFLWRI